MIKPTKLSPFKHFCVTIGEIPSSYLESMTYYELLNWFCDYLQNTVIPAVNTNAEAVEEIQALFIELKNYVDTYFDNLDLQEEVNNKLDEMVEEGTLQELINTYQVINVNHFGIMPNTEYDKTINELIETIPNGAILYFPKGTYIFNTNDSVLTIDKPLTVVGDGEDTSIIQNKGLGNIIDIKLETEEKRFVYIEKITLDEYDTNGKCVEVLSANDYYLAQFRMNCVKTINGTYGFYLNGVTSNNLFISSFEKCTIWNGFYANKIGDTIKINNCNFAYSGGIYINQVAGASSLEFTNNNITCTDGFIIDNAGCPLIENNIFEMSRDTNNTNGYVEIGTNLEYRQFEYNIISNMFSYASGYNTPNKPLLYIDKITHANINHNFLGVKDNNYSIVLSSNSVCNELKNTFGVSYASETIAYAYQDNGTNNIINGNYVNNSFVDGKITSNSYDKYSGKKSITGSLQLINSNPVLASSSGYTMINYATYTDDYNVSGTKNIVAITTDGLLPLTLLIGGLSDHCRIKMMGNDLPASNNQRGDILINKYPREAYPYLFYFYNGTAWKGVGTLNDLS